MRNRPDFKETVVDGTSLVAANVERGNPWLKLGKRLDHDMDIDEALGYIGVDEETVEPATLYTMDDTKIVHDTDDGHGPYIYLEDLEEVLPSVGVKSNVFGTMSTPGLRYEITQRREILELAYEIVGLTHGEGHIDVIGNLGDLGQLFFAYIKVPDLIIDPNGVADTLERGLYVATSFDGSMANTIGHSDLRPWCSNVIAMALGNLAQSIKAKHTRNSEDRMREAAVALEYAGAVEQEKIKRAEAMLKVSGDWALEKILDYFWDIKAEGLPESTKTRRENERASVRELYNGEDNTAVRLVGSNGWAAYNAFVEHVDHKRNVRGFNRDVKRAQSAVLPGAVVNDKIKASELVLAWH